MKLALIFLFLVSFSVKAMDLADGSLILTHTSKYYHTDPETEATTQSLMQKAQGPIIALVQNPLATDREWYANPLSLIDHEFYSHAGEHQLTFSTEKKEWHVTVVGGYLTACLGRTLTGLVASFITDSKEATLLTIHLPMKGIFTGFILSNNKLVPQTPYQESILDSSMDGLNLSQVLKQVSPKELESFMRETIKIAIYQKSPMHKMPQENFFLEVRIQGKKIFELGNQKTFKKIRLSFE